MVVGIKKIVATQRPYLRLQTILACLQTSWLTILLICRFQCPKRPNLIRACIRHVWAIALRHLLKLVCHTKRVKFQNRSILRRIQWRLSTNRIKRQARDNSRTIAFAPSIIYLKLSRKAVQARIQEGTLRMIGASSLKSWTRPTLILASYSLTQRVAYQNWQGRSRLVAKDTHHDSTQCTPLQKDSPTSSTRQWTKVRICSQKLQEAGQPTALTSPIPFSIKILFQCSCWTRTPATSNS